MINLGVTAEATKPKDKTLPLPAHVITAQKHLNSIREKDPEIDMTEQ